MDKNRLEHTSPGHLFRILLTLLCFFHHKIGTCAENQLQIDPPSIVVQFGSSASANCSTNDSHKGMGWEASQGSTDMQEDVQFVIWAVDRLEEWDIKPICFANFHDTQRLEKLNITIYKPPEQVTISTMNHTMTEGREYKLECYIPNVAPVHLLTVNWYKGQKLIDSMGNFNMSERPVNHIATLQISPHRSDDGVQYTCEAELKLGPEGPQPPPKMTSAPLTITVHYGPEFSNCEDVVNLNEGSSLAGICDVTGKPSPQSYWEKDGQFINHTIPLNRTSGGQYNIIVNGNIMKTLLVKVIYGPEISCERNYTVREGETFVPKCTVEGFPTSKISWYKDEDEVELLRMHKNDAGQYTLIANNGFSMANYTVELNVVYPPSSISELHSARVSIGETVVLKCASNANPRPSYKWTYHHTSNVHIIDQDGVSLLHIKHARGDNIGMYMCTASNDLGEQLKMVRVDVQGAKPTCPLSVHPDVVEVKYGETVNVECQSSAPKESLGWEIGTSVIRNSTLVINSLDEMDWILKATCHSRFIGLDSCQKDINITIYNLPKKVFIGTKNHTGPMIEGKLYTLHCDVQDVSPVPLLTVNWYKGKDLVKKAHFTEIKTLDNNRLTLTISPRRNDTNTPYSCEAELGLQNSTKVRSSPLKVTVHYKPIISEKFAQRVPLFHGYPVVLSCVASGYPEPTITWMYNNKKTTGANLTVTENPGEYTCMANNSLGTDTRMVTVVMEDTRCELVLRPPEVLVEYGASASVDCSTQTTRTDFRMGWKVPHGAVHMVENVQLITWKVDSLVDWDIQPVCFLNSVASHCSMLLPVTVYKLPDWVSISTVGHTGPMIEHKKYELQCDIYNVAPVHLLTVNWYKGQHLVAKTSFSDSTKTPVNQSTRFPISLNRADDGVLYRCEAVLQLSTTRTGAQTPSKVASQTVHRSAAE
ncbi:hemicentin-1-like isoform X2 [Hemibagrus wyckioides]|uniref:hemicentin-1-like isoform X2 n=1 Tax=Hemibagrus wyckioides TaxID=337641 RepID=UPI00266CB210|nr:hemicentin-1-like isoform X2 [Hemibagrus wyckioides]